MGFNGALGKALHVLGQHLLLVAVGCICLGVKELWSALDHPPLLPRGVGSNPLRPQLDLPWLSPSVLPPSGGRGHSPPG